jgi:hypothetical protein
MKTLLLTLLTSVLSYSGILAQDVYINPCDPDFRARYGSLEFGDKFSLLALSDQDNNYYIVDFTKLPTRFEKIFFLNLVFRSDKVVCIDSDLAQNRIWFSANRQVQETKIRDTFLELKKKSTDAASLFTEEEKTQWMSKNDKYK